MWRFKNERISQFHTGAAIHRYSNHSRVRVLLAGKVNGKLALKSEGGFISIHLLSIYIVAILIFFGVLMGTTFGARKQAVMTYDWFGESMNYASSAAAMYWWNTGSQLNEQVARMTFQLAFAEMTETSFSNGIFNPNAGSPYPGPITLNRFDALAGHGAQEPGYIAEITVPVLSADLPFIGKQYITVPMRYFAAGKNKDIP